MVGKSMRTTSQRHEITPLDQRYFATNPLKWDQNNFYPSLLGKTGSVYDAAPLLDNTHTPRGAKKAITLERSFDRVPWMHNRTGMESFSTAVINKDKNKSKVLRKIIKKSRSRSRSKSMTSMSKRN